MSLLDAALERWEGWEQGDPYDPGTLDQLLAAARNWQALSNPSNELVERVAEAIYTKKWGRAYINALVAMLREYERLVAEAQPPDYEAAAKGMYDDDTFSIFAGVPPENWESEVDEVRDEYRSLARAAVAAALRVEPGTPIRVIVVKDDGQTPQD